MKRSLVAGIQLLALVGAAAAHAQEGPRTAQVYRIGGFVSGRVERVLRLRDALELTESQTSQLEAIRKEDVTRRQNFARDLIDLQSRATAGQITNEELRDQTRKLREASDNGESSVRERIDRILTDQQRRRLDRELRFPGPALRARVLAATPMLRRPALAQNYLRMLPRRHAPDSLRRPEELRRRIEQLRRRREGIL
jgi:Spy/CpxP family protein refolding chaperone